MLTGFLAVVLIVAVAGLVIQRKVIDADRTVIESLFSENGTLTQFNNELIRGVDTTARAAVYNCMAYSYDDGKRDGFAEQDAAPSENTLAAQRVVMALLSSYERTLRAQEQRIHDLNTALRDVVLAERETTPTEPQADGNSNTPQIVVVPRVLPIN